MTLTDWKHLEKYYTFQTQMQPKSTMLVQLIDNPAVIGIIAHDLIVDQNPPHSIWVIVCRFEW